MLFTFKSYTILGNLTYLSVTDTNSPLQKACCGEFYREREMNETERRENEREAR